MSAAEPMVQVFIFFPERVTSLVCGVRLRCYTRVCSVYSGSRLCLEPSIFEAPDS